MASIANDPGGKKRITFTGADGKRKTLRLGKSSMRNAERVQTQVESLLAAQLAGASPPRETSAWLAELDAVMRKRLAAVGLAEAPQAVEAAVTLGALIEMFKTRPKWRAQKDTSRHVYRFGFRHMLAYFGDPPVAAVTDAAAEDFRGYLLEAKPTGAGLSRATANRLCDTGSMLFRYAVRSRLIHANPFEEVKRGVVASTRRAFVDADVSGKVLAAMKDSQWRLLFALARWGGLRVPSEPRLLRWGDVDWGNNRFTVTSPKTEHHEGHERRVVPIFPELLKLFEERYEAAAPGDELVLPFMVGRDNSTFRNQLDRTVVKLGLTRWPRIFHNLRSTRQTELEQLYPTYVVCAWLGNSVSVAAKHYLQVTDEHFQKAAHNAAQNTSASVGTDRNSVPAEKENPR